MPKSIVLPLIFPPAFLPASKTFLRSDFEASSRSTDSVKSFLPNLLPAIFYPF